MSNYHFADEHSSPGRAWVSMDIAVWMSCSAINLHEVRALPECQLLIHHRVCQFRCLPGYGMSRTPREQSGSRGRQCRAPCRLGTSSRGWAHGRQLWGSRVRDGHQWRGACTTQEGARTGSDGVVRIQACSATGHDTMAKWLQTSERAGQCGFSWISNCSTRGSSMKIPLVTGWWTIHTLSTVYR